MKALVLVLALTSLAVDTVQAKPLKSQRLSYAKAKRAIQAKADGIAGTSTRITVMYRIGDTKYSGSADWSREDPVGCKGCGYDPVTGSFYDTPTTEYCSVSLVAKLLTSGKIRVSTESLTCF